MNMVAPARTVVQRPYRISLIAGPAAAAQARRHVCAVIEAWDVPVDDYTAALLTSELVTNAIRHGKLGNDGIELVVSWAYNQLRVEVHDRAKSGPVLVDAPWDAEAGRGLSAAGQPVHQLGLAADGDREGRLLHARGPGLSQERARAASPTWEKAPRACPGTRPGLAHGRGLLLPAS